ncbi:putative B3 domain-containing protein Os03g0621600 isoform X2 [Juglans regia]|uniref:B3 domain-containing protein Os03g0621600 isoform X2 n=1 Tax=Juglans regia TaxID=51240 RepID=A0A6P9DV14_JUGRE|nr:putative B3 domain-containing protein Os03g0621600 isoform X2 [Juglans regia]
MTSHGRRDYESSAITLKAPHFFKIILPRCLQDRKLMIPRRFIRKYGEGLSNVAFLKLPNGAEWKLELTKCDGRVWLQKGWQEFMEYYSLKLGHLLVFRYEGNSHFYILVFDESATEIDYPSSSSLGEGENLDGELLVSRMEQTDSDSHAQILDDFPTLTKTRKKSQLPSPQPRKMMRTNRSAKPASTSNLSRSVPPHRSKDAKVKKLKAQANFYPPKQELDAKGSKPVPTTKRCPKSKTLRMTRMLNVNEKARALQRASGFRPESPYFKVVLQPSYLCRGCKMCFPRSEEGIQKKENKRKKERAKTTMAMSRVRRQPSFPDDGPEFFKVFLPFTSSHQMSIPPAFIKHFNGTIPKKAILIDHTGNSWTVGLEQINRRLCFKYGWQQFASDHSLEFGDFIIFKYTKSCMFKVKIFNKTGCMKYEAEATGKTIPFVTFEEDTIAERVCGRLTRAGKRKLLEICLEKNEEAGLSKAGRQTSRTIVEQKTSIDVARFVTPKNPYCVVSISNRDKNFTCLHKSVVEAFNIKLNQDMVICSPNEEKFPVKIVIWKSGRIIISKGWSAFARKNNVQPKDQCVFEFVLGRGNICSEMRVQILQGKARLEELSKHRYQYRKKKAWFANL